MVTTTERLRSLERTRVSKSDLVLLLSMAMPKVPKATVHRVVTQLGRHIKEACKLGLVVELSGFGVWKPRLVRARVVVGTDGREHLLPARIRVTMSPTRRVRFPNG